MSCFPESIWMIYADGELAADERAPLEAHLVVCRECRSLVSDLRDENALLADTLRERVPQAALPESPPAEPGLAWGLPVAVGAVALVLAVGTLLLETRLPGGLSWLNPLNLLGAYDMLFDLVFLLRDRAPGLFELALSLGAVAGVSALGSFALGVLSRRLSGPVSLSVCAVLAVVAAGPARALDVRLDQDVHVAEGETVNESLLVTGDNVLVDGTVAGDLIVAAERLTLRGTVDGSLYVFARDVEISGLVRGGVHAVTKRTRIEGEVAGSIWAAGKSLALDAGARARRDVTHFGDHAVLGGEIDRDVLFGGEWLELRGRVGRDVEVLHAERLALLSGARVEGDLHAALRDEIETAPGAVVAGEITTEPTRLEKEHLLSRYGRPGFWALMVVEFAAAFLFGLVLYALVPRLFRLDLPSTAAFFRSLGIGLVAAVVTPVAIALVALTVVGIPIALVSLFLFLTALYLASILVGAMLGRALRPPPDEGVRSFGVALLLGLGTVHVAVHVPFLGLPLFLVTVLFGLGVLVQRGLRLAGVQVA